MLTMKHPHLFYLQVGKAEIRNLAAPIGINSNFSLVSDFTASSSGNTPHNLYSSIFQSGICRP